jgi:hypothetical protein
LTVAHASTSREDEVIFFSLSLSMGDEPHRVQG